MKNYWEKLDAFLGLLVISSILALIFILSHTAIYDLDIWLHLKSGEFIFQHKIIPLQDIFSFTLNSKPWIDHSWLFQVLVYFFHSLWQADGLIFLQGAVITTAFLILFLLGYRITKSFLEAAVLIFLAALACLDRFNIRPEIFSLLFFSLYLYFLSLHIEKKRLWLLLLLQVLWVNFHGYFILGPLLIFLFILSEFIRRRISNLPWGLKKGGSLSDAAYLRLKKILPLALLACLVNPYGLSGALYPFSIAWEVLTGKTQIFQQNIQELLPTLKLLGYLSSAYFYLAMAVVCFLVMLLNFKKLKVIEIILVSVFFIFSFTVRNIAFFLFIAYWVIASYIVSSIAKIAANTKLKNPITNSSFFLLRCILSLAVIIAVSFHIKQNLSQRYFDFEKNVFKSSLLGINYTAFPKKAADFILANNIPGNIFNEFDDGAYLIGRLYPKKKVFIDGRTELYGPQFFKEYLKAMQGEREAFDRIIKSYDIGAVILNINASPLPEILRRLYKDPRWQLVFLDGTSVIFLKSAPDNIFLIKKYKVDLKKYITPKANIIKSADEIIYPKPYLNRAFLFNFWGEYGLAIKECQEALRVMPECFAAHYLKAKAYMHQNLFKEAILSLRPALALEPRNKEAANDLGICLKKLSCNL